MQGWFTIAWSINVNDDINRLKETNHMVMSVGRKNTFDYQCKFMVRMLNKLGKEGDSLTCWDY